MLVKGWRQYQALDANFSEGPSSILSSVEANSITLDEKTATLVKSAMALKSTDVPKAKAVVSIITAFQALWRPLGKDAQGNQETRTGLAAKCWKGLESRNMTLPPPLSLMLYAAAGIKVKQEEQD